ncbi:hypothetical protein O9K51_05136 [Purpureocillium lavendulum]|uniref:Uncharacterized protein n=1 Tax=Purpureocillium lavendulum TaxID=1247861 RepID=A0AB34FU28_9HYPO|nr:hypothetical protein O9K51_05136 [Purpureocillium lavendulum]
MQTGSGRWKDLRESYGYVASSRVYLSAEGEEEGEEEEEEEEEEDDDDDDDDEWRGAGSADARRHVTDDKATDDGRGRRGRVFLRRGQGPTTLTN